jgi:hypothetical protein
MKERIVRTFCALMLCSLLLLTVGTAMAAEPGYERTSYPTVVTPTIDGMWTSDDEWTDGDFTWIGEDVAFTSTWDFDGTVATTRWLVEFFSDTTDDANDYWQFCIDGDQGGGSSPQPSDYMFKIIGHTNLQWYTGGVGEWMGPVTLGESEIDWANSLSASPTNSTPHWILEFVIAKGTGTVQMGILWNFLLGVYDASNPGLLAWPPTNPDVPNTWGIENYSSEAIPEGLTFAVMALLSSISVLIGYKYFIKRKETKDDTQ